MSSLPDPGRAPDPSRVPGSTPPRIGPWLTAVVASALVGTVALGVGAVGVASWWLSRDGQPVTATAVSGASTDPEDDGYAVWAHNDDGLPVRWDPCSPIELVVASAFAPHGFLDDLEVAIAKLREVTGLDLVIVGATAERPAAERLPYQPERYGDRWAPVLIAWASPEETAARLRDIDRAVATPIAVGPEGDRTYVSGQIVFNRDQHGLTAGFDDRATSWGATVLHELGHLLGLAHVDDPGELMATYPGSGPVRFGPGDLRGLAAVGGEHGCRPVPRAGQVEVTTSRHGR